MRDKVVVVTGGYGVLGCAVAEAALAAGAYVAIPGREQESKIPVRDRLLVLGGVDLTDFAAAKQAFEEVATRSAASTRWPMSRAASAGRRSAMAISPDGQRCSG
jgi:NAD(P)-dependent dehydrogenase (short-subunit alcohol dehydrogenase family)